jgi:hypothetical protein
MTRGRARDVCTTAQTPRIAGLYPYIHSWKGDHVLSTLIIVLLVLWLLGVATSYTLGGLIHILLVIAIVAVLLRVIQGRTLLRG